MPSTNSHDSKRAILYARVSTDEQARTGYSLAQQLEALKEYAAREGYEVLEEVSDPGQSGSSLERPGMDRVRDVVAAGGVSVVLAQDRDRFAREPAYHYLLKRELEEHGTKIRALNDRGDESPEGELTDGILDQLAKYERAKIAERTRRGKLRKAREGKVLATQMPNYGFDFNNERDGYVVNEEKMAVVRRIFRMVGTEGASLGKVKKTLDREGTPTPAGGGSWSRVMLRRFILNDVYKPHSVSELGDILAPEVVARLDQNRFYGVWWYSRRHVTERRIRENGDYKKRTKSLWKPRNEWIGVPVPNSGIPRELVDAAREVIKDNQAPSSAGFRFWELSGGAIRCAACGTAMEPHTVGRKDGKKNYYYQCRRRYNNGSLDCTNRKILRAEEVEGKVWALVGGLLEDPERLRAGLEELIAEERRGTRGNPEREELAWTDKIAEVNRKRSRYQEMAAEGLITLDELREKPTSLEETRETAKRELDALCRRRESAAALERDAEALLDSYAGTVPEALDLLTSEERHKVYRMLRLKVLAH